MRFLCLCPLYNHHQRLTQNVYQAMLDQTHEEWVLVLGDDRPKEAQLRGLVEPDGRVHIVRFPERCPTMGEKYAGMVASAEAVGIHYDAIAIVDGDDMFSEYHLALHARILAHWGYSRPSIVFTSFAGIVQIESSAGRFWSSVAFTKSALASVGGFGASRIVGFDQEMLGKFSAVFGEPDHAVPTYCYRWADTQSDHTSGHSNGFNCTEWYNRTPVIPAEGLLYPKYDQFTENVIIPGMRQLYVDRLTKGLTGP